MPATYEPIATVTLGSAASTISFSSIPSTYTDLHISFIGLTTTSSQQLNLTFNGNTTGYNHIYGYTESFTPSVAQGSNYNVSNIFLGTNPNTTDPMTVNIDIFGYAGGLYKNVVRQTTALTNDTSSFVHWGSGQWMNTSAITSITLTSAGTIVAGGTATLYGIKAA